MISIALIVASWIVVSVVVACCLGHTIKVADLRSPGPTAPATVARPEAFFAEPSDARTGLRTAG